MRPTDFAGYLTEFLTRYLVTQKNVSRNTIFSYRDTFKLLLRYCQQVKNIVPEKVTMTILTSDLLTGFLEWLETNRRCGVATRNQRLAAIHSFFRYVQAEEPAGLFYYQKVMAIPQKKTQSAVVEYLTPDAMKHLLEQPDKQLAKGRRDLTLLCTLYDTGARVQELIDLRVCDVTLENPAVITLTGKGNKVRRVPVMKNTADLLKRYLVERNLEKQWKGQYSLFTNSQHNKLTKEGVAHIVCKYADAARKTSLLTPKNIRPHMFRHSKAMHLLQAGVNLIYIRDFLGHVDLKTTEIYARADTETKRKVLENAYPDLVDSSLPDWNKDEALLAWLSELR